MTYTGTLIDDLRDLEEMVRSGKGLELGDGFTDRQRVNATILPTSSADKSVEYSPSSTEMEAFAFKTRNDPEPDED